MNKKEEKEATIKRALEKNKKIIAKENPAHRPDPSEIRCVECPHALWGFHADGEGLSCKCKILYAITYTKTEENGITDCQGTEDEIYKADSQSDMAKALPCWTCAKALWYWRKERLSCHCKDWQSLVFGKDSKNREIPVFRDCAGYELDQEEKEV